MPPAHLLAPLACLLVAGCSQTAAAGRRPPPVACPAAEIDSDLPLGGLMYGVPVAGDSYGHTPRYDEAAAMSFTALHRGALCRVTILNRVYTAAEWQQDDGKGYNSKFRCRNADLDCKFRRMRNGGYSWGDGGRLKLTINGDDGTGHPTNEVLATAKEMIRPVGNEPTLLGRYQGVPYYVPDKGFTAQPYFDLEQCLETEPGRRYTIVLHQESPTTGGIVLNGTWLNYPASPAHGPFYGGGIVTYKRGKGSPWTTRAEDGADGEVLPFYTLVYSDGTIEGPGYAGIGGGGSTIDFSGETLVRENFIVKGPDRTVDGFWVRVGRSRGTGPLDVTLADAKVTIAEVSVPGRDIRRLGSVYDGRVDWIHIALPEAVTLRSAGRYTLQLRTATETGYFIGTSEQVTQARAASQVWGGPDSRAELSEDGGQTWTLWPRHYDDGTAKPNPQADLPVVFTIAGKARRFGC